MRVVELRWEKHLLVSIFLVFLTFLAHSSSEDGFYEYKFRVRNIDGDNVIKVFEGHYDVKIFKTINTNYNFLS